MSFETIFPLQTKPDTPATLRSLLDRIGTEATDNDTKIAVLNDRRAHLLLEGTIQDIRSVEVELADRSVYRDQLAGVHKRLAAELPDLIKIETATALRARVAETDALCNAARTLIREKYEAIARQFLPLLQAEAAATAAFQQCYRAIGKEPDVVREFAIRPPIGLGRVTAGVAFTLGEAIKYLPALAPIDGEEPSIGARIWPVPDPPRPPYVPPPPRVFPPSKQPAGHTIRHPGTPVGAVFE